MSGLFTGYSQATGASAPAGTKIGTLSIVAASGFVFHLADGAEGHFAIEGRNIVVGRAALSRDALPKPKILVAASDGHRAAAELLTINLRRPLPALPLPVGARVAVHGDSQSGFNNA